MLHRNAVHVSDIVGPGVVDIVSASNSPRHAGPGPEVSVRVEEASVVVDKSVFTRPGHVQHGPNVNVGQGAVGVKEETSSMPNGCQVGLVLRQGTLAARGI